MSKIYIGQQGFIRNIPVAVVGFDLDAAPRDALKCRVVRDCDLAANTKIICAISEFDSIEERANEQRWLAESQEVQP